MTDRFEEAVRAAARGLGDPGPTPSYNHAWQRGRCRRASKQAALGFGGAALLVALLTVGFPGLDGSRLEGDDLAVDLQASSPGAVLATPTVAAAGSDPLASPLPGPTADPGASAVVGATGDDTDASASATARPVPTPQQAPESPPATSQPVAPAPQPTRPSGTQPPPTAVPPTPRAGPTSTPATSSNTTGPTAVPTPNGETTLAAPSAMPGVTVSPASPNQTSTASAAGPLQSPKPAAAVVIGSLGTSVGARCDTNGDGLADATCELQLPYACTGAAEARLGFVALDLNGNGQIDTCTSTSTAFCDTTGDGFGDTPCVIRPDPA